MKITAVVMAFVLALFLVMTSPTFGLARADESNFEEDTPSCMVSGLPTDVYVERETLVLAIGSDAIHSHDLTRNIFKIAWKSDGLRDLREAFEASGYETIESQSVVAVNISAGGAIVIVPVVLGTDPEVTEKLVTVVDVQEQIVVGTLVGSEVTAGSHISCFWFFCINWCELMAAAAVGACITGCVAACCIPFPPACPLCSRLCPLCTFGYEVVYNACVDWLH